MLKNSEASRSTQLKELKTKLREWSGDSFLKEIWPIILVFVKYEDTGKVILKSLIEVLEDRSSKKYKLNKLKRNIKKNQ